MRFQLYQTSKFIGTVIRAALGESGIPVKSLTADIVFTTDLDNRVDIKLSGAPPFTTLRVQIDNEEPIFFKGHPDMTWD